MRVKQCGWLLCAMACIELGATQASAQNLLANPGFEDPITFEGTTFTGSWEGFNGGGTAAAANSNVMPRTGAMHLDAHITASNNNFAGVFQDVEGLVPGQLGDFRVWAKNAGTVLDLGAEMRIEWRKVGQMAEVSRTGNFVPTLTAQYQQFGVSGLVPAGADTARVVFAVQTFGPEPTNTGIVFVDDASFVIPEPAAIVLAGIVTLFVGFGRRR
jgi:hypothetical protein